MSNVEFSQRAAQRSTSRNERLEVRAMKQLKIWNGRPYGVLPSSQWKETHIYVAAYSIADVQRLCGELGLSIPSRREIAVYWSENCWGDEMEGIQVERGVWMTEGYRSVPKRLTSNGGGISGLRTPQ